MRRYNIPQSKKKSGESKSANRRSKINRCEISLMTNMSQYEEMMDKCDNDKALCLFVAVICRIPEQVRLHLTTGPNVVLKGCYTPLHFLHFSEIPKTEDNYPTIRRTILDKSTKEIIDLLTSSGARLLPDPYGHTPLSMSAWRCSKLGQYLIVTANCTVSDVINYGYFSLPPQRLNNHYSFIKPNVSMSNIRLKRALLLHVKHGVTPHYIPIDTSRRLLTCVSDASVTDSFQVYSSQLSSYFNLVDTPGKILFPGVYYLLQQVVETTVSDSAEFDNYYSLFDTLSIIDRVELLNFAMSFAFNFNEPVCKYSENTVLHLAAIACDSELIRIYLNAGVSPMVRNASGDTFLSILRKKDIALYTNICQEFDLGKPYKLMVLCAYVYIRYRCPLIHLHKHKQLKQFIIQLSTSQECKQMCSHCYKEYYL